MNSTQTLVKIATEVLQVSRPLLDDRLTELTTQLDRLINIQGEAVSTIRDNTAAVLQAAVRGYERAPLEIADKVGAARRMAGGGLLLSPIFSGLMRIFTRQEKKEQLTLSHSMQGQENQLEWALGFGSMQVVRIPGYDYQGLVRGVQQKQADGRFEMSANNNEVEKTSSVRWMPTVAPQVTIQIQALDSRSILDRSEDIAKAVQVAMLHSHELKTTLSEL